jgi:hypothetical protein
MSDLVSHQQDTQVGIIRPYPQTPVTLMCRRTSPRAGAYTGASSCFNLWSAVTINDGFGNGVERVLGVLVDSDSGVG